MMLLKLLTELGRGRFDPVVVSLVSVGPVGDRLRAMGIPVHCLDLRRGIPDPRSVWRLSRLLARERPRLVQTWMYHADLIGGLAAAMAGGPPVAWNIRQAVISRRLHKAGTLWTAKICARLSRRLPDRIVCCSEAARAVHIAMGYDAGRMTVIPNGFDLDAFRPDPGAGRSLRRELGVSESAPLIGLAARLHPQKDHANFLDAAGRLGKARPDVHFVLCGDGVTEDAAELVAWVDEAGLRGRCHLLGRRSDMPTFQAALDIATCSSITEGFPNVVGEAMASGVPCAVTDVGDSAFLVGETGRVVPARDPAALAGAWESLLALPPEGRAALGAAARHRVAGHFSLAAVAARYAVLYESMIADARAPSSPPAPSGRPASTGGRTRLVPGASSTRRS